MKLAIFDMDGTILDTLEDLYNATNYVLTLNHLPIRTLEEVRSFVGNGIYRLVELAAPTICPKPLIDLMYDDFCDYYKDHCAIKTKPYEGIIEVIQSLKRKGIKVAVVSNKADFAVQELCEQYFHGLFDKAVGSKENVRKKPYPDSVNEVLNALEISANEAIYIGDSEVDIETANNAKMDYIICSWGFRDEAFLKEQGATTIIHQPIELLEKIHFNESDWNPNQYELFLKERNQPNLDLLQRLEMMPASILDLGCGPGNSTYLLSQKYPNASIIGGDISQNMLEKAKENYPELNFIYFDGSTDFKENSYDLIYSNACIHWIPDHASLFSNMYQALRVGGTIAIQLPLQNEMMIQTIMEKIAIQYGLEPRNNYTLTIEAYHDLISSLTNQFTIWKTTYMHRMPSIDSIIEWFKGSSLKVYLPKLSPENQQAYLADLKKELQSYYHPQANGEYILEFPRLFMLIQK